MKREKKESSYVFILSAVIGTGIALWGILGGESFMDFADRAMRFLKQRFSWFYLASMLFLVLFGLVLAFSKYGRIRLGDDDEKPEYSTLSWFAMLFAAGMGVGLVFWGIAEPLSHYVLPMKGIEPYSAEAEHFAVRSCIMHWGLHPWACYAILGLGLAYFQFRRKKPALVSSLMVPVFGEKYAAGVPGKVVDILTTVITAVGVATSFGMGCLQISAGLKYLFRIPETVVTWVIFILVVGVIYTYSAVLGLDRGIKIISDSNMIVCVLLLAAAFLVGPKAKIIQDLLVGLKDYVVNFFPDSLRLSSQGDSTWIQNWRVFYWAWWLSWAPFVGVFVARISRGRTIREFILGVMIVPALVSALWFTVMGEISFNVADHFTHEQLETIIASPQTALYHIFGEYPFGKVLAVVAMVLVIMFFITSANSAIYVLAMLTSDGDLNPGGGKMIFWGILIGVTALAMILSGGIEGIQSISIVIAFPYMFILLLICVSIVKELRKKRR